MVSKKVYKKKALIAGIALSLLAFLPFTAFALVTPNDPGFTADFNDIDRAWGLVSTRFPQAWDMSYGSITTVAAILDTGLDELHEDLKDVRFVGGFNVLTNSEIVLPSDSDDNGHGTLVASILASTPNNNKGIAGTNWNITIMPVKVLDAQGGGTTESLTKGIYWATDHGAQIINLSLGGVGFEHDPGLADAIKYAYQRNVLIVAAAGNDTESTGVNLDEQPTFPVCDDNGENMVLGVAAVDNTDRKPAFSNYGKACVDVVAPGKRILSAINHDPVSGSLAPNAYAYASGTSQAVPFVSGLAALLKSMYPLATNAQIRDNIIATADPVDLVNEAACGGKSCMGLLGAGRINAEKSLALGIPKTELLSGDLVTNSQNGATYLISGGKRQLVSSFVFNQRFMGQAPKIVPISLLMQFPEGSFAEPLTGTLVKEPNNQTVYYIRNGLKLPITGTVFNMWGFKFGQVQTVTYSELSSWLVGSLLAPPEGTLLRTAKGRQVYWVAGGVLHPITRQAYDRLGLGIFKIVLLQDKEIQQLPRGEAYLY